MLKKRSDSELANIASSWDMQDGVLVWKRKASGGKNIGDAVGITTLLNGHQNCYLSFNGKLIGYSVGQVAWYLYTGEWPSEEVDHIDANPQNHSKENLRLSNRQQQCMNRISGKAGRLNKGVYKREYGERWSAQIWVNGKCKCLGTYDSESEAVQARIEATKMLHGDFANIKSYAEAA
jgi:hypothetical protein